jgi:hypothetical protein
VNQFVLLGTTTNVPTGTRSSCYRGPKSDETSWHSTTCRGRNFTNLESFGFFLTRSRVFRPVGKRAFVNSHQRARTGHRCSKAGSRSRNWTAADLGADRASHWFSAPGELLHSGGAGRKAHHVCVSIRQSKFVIVCVRPARPFQDRILWTRNMHRHRAWRLVHDRNPP